MATIAKMHCNTVKSTGGGTHVPLCVAHEVLEMWPPAEVNVGVVYGHGEGECAQCDELSRALDHEDAAGRRMVYLPGKGREEVSLNAVMSGGPDDPNSKWAAATPSGELTMSIDNPKAWGFFEPGAEYMVEIRRHVPSRGNRGQSNE